MKFLVFAEIGQLGRELVHRAGVTPAARKGEQVVPAARKGEKVVPAARKGEKVVPEMRGLEKAEA